MITVSVLLPARDAEATLAEALHSIRGQSGLGDDLEILVMDDGSEDGTRALAASTAAEDPRVRLLTLPRLGVVSALNHGLSVARGRFVARMDADDRCHPDRLRIQLAKLARCPWLDMVGTNAVMFPEDEVSDTMADYVAWQNGLLTHRAIERELLVESPYVHGSTLMRTDRLLALGGWRDVDGPEDVDLWLRAAAAGWRFGKVNRLLYQWREHPNRMTREDPKLSREGFRRVGLEAFAAAWDRTRPLVVWGWGDSLEGWRDGLAARGIETLAAPVNPRALRGGMTPRFPGAPEAVASPSLVTPHDPGPDGRTGWLLAYGARRSRETLRMMLARKGYRAGVQYRFVS